MFFLVTGTDTDKARAKARELISLMEKKRPDATSIRVLADTATMSMVDELVLSQGLFEAKTITFFDEVFENEDVGARVIAVVDALKLSQNGFVLFEEKLSKKNLEILSGSAEKVFHFDSTEPSSDYSMFPIADAFGSCDKRSLWLLIREALDHGSPAEEIHGIMWWQVKAIAIVRIAKDAKSAGLAPFVFTKAKRFSMAFSSEQIEKIMCDLVAIYHKAHRGEIDFNVALERFALDFPVSHVEK
jgi:hypothetical protein